MGRCHSHHGDQKFDAELQIVYGDVYAPGFPVSQGDFLTRETIRKMAHTFMRKGPGGNIDVQHSQERSGAYVVESFIARDDDSVFISGSWVIGVKVPDPELWGQIKSGELNGFSLDGKAMRVDSVLEIDMPDFLRGETEATAGHGHPSRPAMTSRESPRRMTGPATGRMSITSSAAPPPRSRTGIRTASPS